MDRELQNLRRGLAQVERGPGCWYPEELRQETVGWVRRRRAGGASWRVIGGEVGMSVETLRRWVSRRGDVRALIPIEIIADASSMTIEPMSGGPRIITRAGHRIEGLSVADVIAIARVLG